MAKQNMGRVNPAHGDLSHVESAQRRVATVEDVKTFRSNDKALNQQMGMKRDAKTDLVNPNYRAGNPLADCKRLHQQGLKPQQIALKLNSFGYPRATIQRAMHQGIPQYRNMPKKQFERHFKQHIQPALRTKQAVRNQARMQKFKQQNGIPKNYANMQGLRQVGKTQAREAKIQAKAQGTHERKVTGQNRMEGIKAAAIKQQTRQPTAANRAGTAPKQSVNRQPVSRQQSANRQPTRERYNPSAARARAQQVRQTPPPQQTQAKGMRR